MTGAPDTPAMDAVELSVLIPTYNERAHVDELIACVRAQRYPGAVEFLFIDGGSTDGTREALAEAVRAEPTMRLLDNPARRTPNALNVGLASARGEFIARMDGHTVYPPDYLALAVERLRRGDVTWVTGAALPRGTGVWSRRITLALESRVGVGTAVFRRPSEGEVVSDTGFTGVLRRSTLERLGGWDEGWPVNQDGELAGRVRAAGGTIVIVPALAAWYTPRDSPRALALQYFRYGFYKAKTSRRHPSTLRRPQVLPPLLVLGTCAAGVPGRFGRLPRLGAAAYVLLLAAAALRRRRRAPVADVAALPLLWAIMHLSWGAGFLVACARLGPPWRALAHALDRSRP